MLTSRKIDDLLTPAKLRALNFIHQCSEAGIDLLTTCTYRDSEAQDALYFQGRTAPGKIVTRARGGESFHQWHVAFDVVPLRAGKPVWDDEDPIWQKVGAIGEACGLEWAGRWEHNREFPHFQYTGGLTIADFKSGKMIPAELTFPKRSATA